MPVNEIKSARMLVVTRDPSALRPLRDVGEAHEWRIENAESGWEALERVQSGTTPDLLVLDLPRGDVDSLHTLRWLRRVRPELPIILLAYPGNAAQRIEAIRLGAQEYLVRPLDQKRLEDALKHHLDPISHNGNHKAIEAADPDIERLNDDTSFIGVSPVMRKLRTQAELLAQVDVPVLLVGESGCGKEVAARLIHRLSARARFKFLKINCAALSPELLEAELFGYEQTSAAGGTRTKAGQFELCDRGTILLEEVAEMPNGLQLKLLRLLQENQLCRIGGETPVEIDLRILASTKNNIDQALAGKALREDLYYSLSAFTMHVPPLRQRKQEIPLLLAHFMHQLARHYKLPARSFSPEIIDMCQSYPWPGNLRELENFVKRYLVVGDADLLTRELELTRRSDVLNRHSWESSESAEISTGNNVFPQERSSSLKSLVRSVRGEAERTAIADALDQTRWNRKAAAKLLQVSYRTLLYKIEQYRMSPPPYLSPHMGIHGSKANGPGN